jgi:hypothetical protein
MSLNTKDWGKRDSKKRRDARSVKTPGDDIPRHISHKNKKWCRGRKGVEHKKVCVDNDKLKSMKMLVCKSCGKHLDFWVSGALFHGPKPDWVV